MQDLHVRHAPTLVSHVVRHQAQTLGFNFALHVPAIAGKHQAAASQSFATGVRVRPTIKERRKHEAIAMEVRSHEKRRSAYRIERHQVSSRPKVVQMIAAAVAPGVSIEAAASILFDAMRLNDVAAGGEQLLDDVRRILDDIDVNPQRPFTIAQGPK